MQNMLRTQIHQSTAASQCFFFLQSPFIHRSNGVGSSSSSLGFRRKHNFPKKKKISLSNIKAQSSETIAATIDQKDVTVKADITIQLSVGGFLSSIGLSHGLDDITDLLGKSLLLELVSAELDPHTGLEKRAAKGYAHKVKQEGDDVKYAAEIVVPSDFGDIGAVLVENEHHKEMYLKDMVLNGMPGGPVTVICNSWVHSKFDIPEKRVFFTSKSYLPSQTPSGLKKYREKELESLRGNGEGERQKADRIYDYDTYNDLGNPDSSADLKRPVLGGNKEFPYPRRCRTGRPPCKTDPASESRSSSVYVPRDEQFSEIKNLTFSATTVYSVLHAVIPSLETAVLDSSLGFPFFTAIDTLFNEGVNVPDLNTKKGFLKNILPRLIKALKDLERDILAFETPELILRDKFAWDRDEEFSRQTLAGINPYVLKLVTEWPLKSSLDPEIYGPQESSITTEIVESQIKGVLTLEEALKQKKLFVVDYHDTLLPYVNKVREINGTTLYGSRTLFLLTPESTLRPLAIELTRPPSETKPLWRKVYTPGHDSTACWLWRLAKIHFLAHDSGIHQLVSHWLRTHCSMEPYIIAGNRQLSAMHPIYRLLHPHFRYTMEINALAREALINAGGIIESSFSPGKYAIQLSSVAYKAWRFDQEALPADLISRGLAVEDPTAPHGLKLAIKDYPFANDGLLLWDRLKQWVSDYVNHYYPDPAQIQSDHELQSWWTEIRTKGHADKKDEPWWPKLETRDDLIGILTTIIWVPSGHHAAVNFGQYHYAGYFPNRPTIARVNMPDEDPNETQWKMFLEKPEVMMLMTYPSQIQATKVMAVLDVLSSHSPDEEYLGETIEPSWASDPIIAAAYERFTGRLKELEGIIDDRNANREFRNRHGAGVVPYELLKPLSEPGVTGKGVPYSISI
ncbi:Lipoxygenase, C-terminal [Dillenia turbinata]|uniref:Lipoxygenase n=1 Tax=Dillenia turbinata TaxID=194707 RepID=A0AAN8VL55_9MAGN